MRSRKDFPSVLLLVGMLALLPMSLLTTLTDKVYAQDIFGIRERTSDILEDEFGIQELFPTANSGPAWFLNEDPEDDENFDYTSAEDIELKKQGSRVWELDAETGTHEHGVRLHANSPEGEWKNVEVTGYFKLLDGDDQFTLVARQGPSYNDDGGCGAYGYYGMLSADGDAYFKKKLFHHGGGYTDRTAVEEGVVDDLEDRWVGIKLLVYDLNDDEVKLELWIDDGDEQNNWEKVTEYVDDGDWETEDSDCDRSSDDIIEEGPRGGFRIDDSEFEFKDLSIREIGT